MSPHLKSYGGNPFIKVRLDPEVIILLHDKFPSTAGRTSGVASWVRGLIYRELGLGEAPKFAAEISPRYANRQARKAKKKAQQE
jgi:hypothetical protein